MATPKWQNVAADAGAALTAVYGEEDAAAEDEAPAEEVAEPSDLPEWATPVNGLIAVLVLVILVGFLRRA
jgi:hypothetical protein